MAPAACENFWRQRRGQKHAHRHDGRNTGADITVLALIGERGREVREFLEGSLGEEGRKRAVVVVSTSDQSPLLRIRAALSATSIAEHFCARGKNVLLVVDSLTRLAMAQREISLAVLRIGAYQKGADATLDQAVAHMPEINGLLRQGPQEAVSLAGAVEAFLALPN